MEDTTSSRPEVDHALVTPGYDQDQTGGSESEGGESEGSKILMAVSHEEKPGLEATEDEGASGSESTNANGFNCKHGFYYSPGRLAELALTLKEHTTAATMCIALEDVLDMVMMTQLCVFKHLKETGYISVAFTQAKQDAWHRATEAAGHVKTEHEKHQWIISGCGGDEVLMSAAKDGVCRHNPIAGKVLSIPDVAADVRTTDSWYTKNGLKAYCGIRLTTLTECTLCVLWQHKLPDPSALRMAEEFLKGSAKILDSMITVVGHRVYLNKALSLTQIKFDQQEKQTRYVSHEVINQLSPFLADSEQDFLSESDVLAKTMATVVSILRDPAATTLKLQSTTSYVSARLWFAQVASFSKQVVKNPKVKFSSSLKFERVSDEIEICIDNNRLRQAVVNLLVNANKFTEDGSIKWTMRISPCNSIASTADKVEVKLVLSDTGCGIEKQDLARVTEMFVQVGTPESRLLGSGIGLGISKTVVERIHGGKMDIESAVGKGTSVSIVFNCATRLSATRP